MDIKELEAIVGVGNATADEPLSKHTTFRVGGLADAFVCPGSVDEVQEVVLYCNDRSLPLHVLGSGSNLLVADEGVRGVVMRLGPRFSDVSCSREGRVRAQAGATNAKIARIALEAGLSGFEFAAGIPGTIGGAAIMNAGAYGGELRDVALGASVLTDEAKLQEVSADRADWGYRHSMMGDAGWTILSVEMALEPADPEEIRSRMESLAARRAEKQPLDMPSAGSTFKRPEGYYAGTLIEEAGLKGYSVGGAQVSKKHAGFVVNAGGATAKDIRQVIEDVARIVWERTGVLLEPEVKMWGFDV